MFHGGGCALVTSQTEGLPVQQEAFKAVEPKILYFGTPVALISSLNEDGTTNLAPMSSF